MLHRAPRRSTRVGSYKDRSPNLELKTLRESLDFGLCQSVSRTPNVRMGSNFTVYDVTFKRPLSDPKPALRVADSTDRSWPDSAIGSRANQVTAVAQTR
jgi:hypothetical protein